MMRLCIFSRGLSVFACASSLSHEEMQYCKREYIKEKYIDLSVCRSAYGLNFSIAHDPEESLEQTSLI